MGFEPKALGPPLRAPQHTSTDRHNKGDENPLVFSGEHASLWLGRTLPFSRASPVRGPCQPFGIPGRNQTCVIGLRGIRDM